MSIPNGTYTFESVQFPGVYLRMDGSGVSSPSGSGGGVVNCQFGVQSYEKFKLNCIGNCTYSIESTAFPGVYLRMDGNGVTKFTGPGGGVVNGQFKVASYERFNLIYTDGDQYSFSVESAHFPGVYLRMDGSGVTEFTGPGGGVVNCQFGALPYEKFRLKSA